MSDVKRYMSEIDYGEICKPIMEAYDYGDYVTYDDYQKLEEAYNAAVKYIDKSPCDPDIYPEQYAAYEVYLSTKEKINGN